MGIRRLRSFVQACYRAWIAAGSDDGAGRTGRGVSDPECLPRQKAHGRGLPTAEVLPWQENR
eukprot:4396228-Pleurochrysis_carterae.AAC.2